ncbi:MAG TPA: hypothetical protein DCG47_09320 [Spirochaetaceae bacterium]|nr:hypothetical protein [Spirochaetaceae bacterium]
MVVAKTPLRIPLAGGLSDLKEYANSHGGLTLSATIDKYIYVAVKDNYAKDYELHYLNTHEKAASAEAIRHNHIREAIKMSGMERVALDLSIMNDMPHEGGLGSSGALSSALFSALYAFKGQSVSDERIIKDASALEMDVLEGASGYHDHTITHLGGLRLISYRNAEHESLPLGVRDETLTKFKSRFMLFYSGFHAKTKPSLALLAENLHAVLPEMEAIKANALNMVEALRADDIFAAGACVQRQQDFKQKLPGYFENEFVIETMRRARRLGVYAQIPGGKIGSFLIVFRPKGVKRKKVIKHFGDLQHVPFSFVPEGTKTVSL